jgi:hypothetical protein
MTNRTKHIGMDVHKESISIAVRNAAGKIVMESVIETKASMIMEFFEGLAGTCMSHGAAGQNRSCSFKWAAKLENSSRREVFQSASNDHPH